MNLYQSIGRRKSCRQYDMRPLEPAFFDEVERAIAGFAPLFPEVPLGHRFTRKVKGRFGVQAPHYLIVSGGGGPGEAENTGFLFEQLVLWFDAMEIGCVWLGSSKDAEGNASAGDIIAIAFGRCTEPVHREREAFKRKPIESITNAPDDPCIQAAHLAPSGVNTQPWYFERQPDGSTRVYQQKLKPPISLIYKHSDIDMGIGLCHYALACNEAGKPFRFSRNRDMPDRAGYRSFGVLD